MNQAQLPSDLLGPELMLKLYQELPASDYEQKITLVKARFDEIRNDYEASVLEVRLHSEIGFIYYEAEAYDLASDHFERTLQQLAPADDPFLYFLILVQLIRTYRLLKNYEAAFRWSDVAFATMIHTDSPFDKLAFAEEYGELVQYTNERISVALPPLIEEINNDLGFPEITENNPIATLKVMQQLNKKWNRRLMEIHRMQEENELQALKEFSNTCEIAWYRNYATKQLAGMENQDE